MKKIIYLAGLLAILATSGCVIKEEHRGGVHDPYYHGYGHEYSRPYHYDEFEYRHY
jgi:hypothetical protein